jgi:hypothetical protein
MPNKTVLLHNYFIFLSNVHQAKTGVAVSSISSTAAEIFIKLDEKKGPSILLYNGYRVFPGGKVLPGRDADPSPPSTAEVKNRVELYLYSP